MSAQNTPQQQPQQQAPQQPQQQQAPQQQQQQQQQQGGYQGMNMEPEALRNLIVNYIPTTVDEHQLRQLFEHYGPVESVKIVTNRETKQSRGFGFIKYQYSMSAYNAINCLNSYPLASKRLKVAYAKEAEAAQAQGQMYNPMMMGMNMNMGMNPMYNMQGMGQQMMGYQQQPQQQRQQRPPRQNNAPANNQPAPAAEAAPAQ